MADEGKVPTGLSIWNAMREELTLNLYPLPFTTLPPAIFYVYLHPDDFDRIDDTRLGELTSSLTRPPSHCEHSR